ncbi:CBU_0590 family Dot/Icm T4SS effector, partial [Coxiella burnetii]
MNTRETLALERSGFFCVAMPPRHPRPLVIPAQAGTQRTRAQRAEGAPGSEMTEP